MSLGRGGYLERTEEPAQKMEGDKPSGNRALRGPHSRMGKNKDFKFQALVCRQLEAYSQGHCLTNFLMPLFVNFQREAVMLAS